MAARGVRTLEGLSAREVIWGENDDRPVYDPLRAVVSSRFPLTGLKISFANFGWELYHLASDTLTRQAAQVLFKSLERLDIRSDGYSEVELSHARGTAELLGECANLERLRIAAKVRPNLMPYYETENAMDDEFVSAFLDQHLPRLQVLNMRGFRIPFQPLVAFLKRHPHLWYAGFKHTSFVLLGGEMALPNSELEDHEAQIALFLQEATGLVDVEVRRSMVPQWEVKKEESSDTEASEEEM